MALCFGRKGKSLLNPSKWHKTNRNGITTRKKWHHLSLFQRIQKEYTLNYGEIVELFGFSPIHNKKPSKMKKEKRIDKEVTIPEEIITSKIFLIRGQKVMLDRDLAELYQVETKRLKEAVRRNMDRFPEGFMFEMSKEELNNWRSQFATSNPTDKMGLRHAPFCFSEYGILMLSSVLNSERAIQVSIQIIEMFVKMRKMLQDNSDLFLRMEKLERNVGKHNMQIAQVFQLIKKFIKEDLPRKQIGFKPDNEYDT